MTKVYSRGVPSYAAWRADQKAKIGRDRFIVVGCETPEQAKAAADEVALQEMRERMYGQAKAKA